MLEEDFSMPDFKPMINFKELFFKILGYWMWYIVCLIACFVIAYSC